MEKVVRIQRRIRCFGAALAAFLLFGVAPTFADTTVGGTLSTNMVWTAGGSPYLVTSDVVISSGVTLTVDPGVVVRFQSGTKLTVLNGALAVPGTAASPVVFTSWKNVSGSTPAAGDWGGIEFQNGTLDNRTILDHVTISYGSGAALASASPTFNNCSFENNAAYALSIDLASFPHGTGNTATGNGVNAIRVPAGEMTVSGTWDLTSIPYYLEGEVSIGAAPRLTGVTPTDVEQNSSTTIAINGTRLSGATTVSFTASGLTASILSNASATTIPVQLTADGSVPLGPADVTVTVAAGTASLSSGINIIPPIPRITGLAPDHIFINRPATTIDISGRNFTSDSAAYLNGASLATTFTNSALIQATVPTQTLASAGQLVVQNPDPRTPGSYIASTASLFTIETPQFVFSPNALTLHQGDVSSLNLTIPYVASAGGITANLANANPSALIVPASAVIPEGATSTSVTVTALATGSSATAAATVTASALNWLDGSAQATVRPQQTVNLTPLTTVTGNGWTYYLTISLIEPAVASSVTVTLTSTPAGIVTVPATVTIPQGSISTQTTVTAINPGIATISATAPYPIVSGSTNTVTVRSVQTYGVNPVLGQPVGVLVSQPASSTGTMVSYTPVTSLPVGVAVGSVVSGLSPDLGAIGTSDLTLRVLGVGLSSVTSVTFNPPDGITVQTGTLNATDIAVDVHISIAADAPVSPRTVIVSTGTGVVPPAVPGANLFNVTYQPPQLWSLIPNSGMTGSTITLQVNGRNLQSASEIAFVPPDGISVGNPPTVSTDGTLATVSATISAGTATGLRAVTITTPGGTTSGTLSAANTFEVRSSTPPSGNAYADYTPVVSRIVGVLVSQPSSSAGTTVSYSPVVSLPVGVLSGASITSTNPVSGAIGTSGLLVRVSGTGLASATSLTFYPPDGITIQNGSFAAASDGSHVDVLVDIDQAAPVSTRTVILGGVTAWPAVPGANLFNVTYQPPQLWSLIPNSGMTGSTITLQVNGRNLQSASEIAFVPPDGISVGNPPTVSTDGTLATVSATISAGTATGLRAVTITAPGGTTSSALSAANTFEVRSSTPPSGNTYADYTPVASSAVGVMVTIPTATTMQAVSYGPVDALPVGVAVLQSASSTTVSVNYSALLSLPVGVTVGSSITGIAPSVLRPGTTTNITVSGVGLNAVNAVQIQPSAGFIVGSITPAIDGLSAIVSITTDTAVAIGAKTIVVSSPSGTISPTSPGANELLAGPAPVINSIVPASQVTGTTFTLTINGTYLQGTTAVRFSNMDGILVNNPPAYTTDAQGEHLTVTVILDSLAAGGQRVVIISSPYGESDSTATTANTFQVTNLITGWIPAALKETVIAARKTQLPRPLNTTERIARIGLWEADAAITISRNRGEKKHLDAALVQQANPHTLAARTRTNRDIIVLNDQNRYRLFPGYRGPPPVEAP